MITKCRFCDYQKETPLNTDILYLMEGSAPEDYLVWMQRLVKDGGTADYNSVKIHMGMKHKDLTYKHIHPESKFTDVERSYIDGTAPVR